MAMRLLPPTDHCFACGAFNPLGLKLRFETDGTVARATWVPKAEHGGFPGVVHGGVLSTVLDEVMVWACGIQTRRLAYCAELTVRFAHRAITGEPLTLIGRMTANRKFRVLEAEGEILNADQFRLAASRAKYIPFSQEETERMLKELGQENLFG